MTTEEYVRLVKGGVWYAFFVSGVVFALGSVVMLLVTTIQNEGSPAHWAGAAVGSTIFALIFVSVAQGYFGSEKQKKWGLPGPGRRG